MNTVYLRAGRIDRGVYFLAVCFLLGAGCKPKPSQEVGERHAVNPSYKVVAVTDGDSIKILKDGEAVPIRLEGIDAPEKKQDFGQRSKQAMSDLVFGRTVEVEETGVDRWQRILAHVYVDGQNVSEAMISQGMAWHFKRYNKEENLAAAEVSAREHKAGLWSHPEPVAPWEWRKKK